MSPGARLAPSELESLDRALDSSLRPLRGGDAPVDVLFSGGVDSSLLVWELRNLPSLGLITVGLEGSADLDAARSAAGRLGRPWEPSVLTPAELDRLVPTISDELDGVSPTGRAVLVSLAAGLARSKAARVLCGQGVDELFLGYAHFRGLSPREAETRARLDLRRALDEDGPRAERVARRFGRTLRAPFLGPEFVAAAGSIPIERRLPGALTKECFRAFAQHRGLPAAIAERPKRAIQFGSGVDRWLRST